ncbi:MAG: DUF177 domain-containing protein [Dehalococcoidales bacterium]
MQTNVSGLLKSSIGAERNYEVNGNVNIYGNACAVHGDISLVRTNRGILVKARVETEARVQCSRCLSQFPAPLEFNIEEEYFPLIDVDSGMSLDVPNEPGCFTIDERHILDLSEAVRQYAVMAIPMKPLCRPGCRGLCPGCGHNLNQGPCGCPSQQTDPRWSRLARLLSAVDYSKDEKEGR